MKTFKIDFISSHGKMGYALIDDVDVDEALGQFLQEDSGQRKPIGIYDLVLEKGISLLEAIELPNTDEPQTVLRLSMGIKIPVLESITEVKTKIALKGIQQFTRVVQFTENILVKKQVFINTNTISSHDQFSNARNVLRPN